MHSPGQETLIHSLEKHLGRELTPSERRILLLAAELIEKQSPTSPDTKANTAGQSS